MMAYYYSAERLNRSTLGECIYLSVLIYPINDVRPSVRSFVRSNIRYSPIQKTIINLTILHSPISRPPGKSINQWNESYVAVLDGRVHARVLKVRIRRELEQAQITRI